MSKYISDKIKILSFVCIILVLYIHSGFSNEVLILNEKKTEMQTIYILQFIISGMVGRIAAPLFYIISGYLFFLNVPQGMQSIYKKIYKRGRTLFIPYLIGCLFFVFFNVLIATIPWASKYINSPIMPLFNNSITQIICSIFYDTGNGSPCAFQLWFLRDLILIVATSPLWYLCLKYAKWCFVIITFFLTYISMSYIPITSLFWFVLGGQLTQVNLEHTYKKAGLICCLIFLIFSIVQLLNPNYKIWETARIPIICIGIIGIWNIYNVLIPVQYTLSEHKVMTTLCSFTFFIYLFHEPTLNIFRKIIVAILGKNEIGYIVSYLFSPWLFIISSMIIGFLLKKHYLAIYKVCTGGR